MKSKISPERIAELRQMPYSEYLRTAEWNRRRQVALKIADHKCMICSSAEVLQVHHRTYERLGCEKQTDLLVLCHDCHDLFHRYRRLMLASKEVQV